MSTIEQAARQQEVEHTLIEVGKKLAGMGQELSPKPQAHSYAPSVIAKQPEAKGIRKAELVAALGRLLPAGKIALETVREGTAHEKKVLRFW
jgi:hypothetical protein